MVILNSPEAASDLLGKRSAIYSSRPSFAMTSLAGWDHTMGMLTYGPKFREQRRMKFGIMGTRARVETYNSMLEDEALTYARRLLLYPDNFQLPLKRYVNWCHIYHFRVWAPRRRVLSNMHQSYLRYASGCHTRLQGYRRR